MWTSAVVLVVLGLALTVAILLGGRGDGGIGLLWLGGACLIMGLALAIAVLCSKRYIAAPRRALPGQRDGGALRVVVVEGFLSRLAFGIISFALPLYAYRLGMSLDVIGILLATNTAVAVLLKPLMGMLIDRIGVRASYVVAVALRTCVVLSLVIASHPAHLFVARALHGVAIALRDPSSATVLTALGGKKAVAQRFAWYQTAKTVAGSAGGFVAGMLITFVAGDYGLVFEVSALLSGLPMILVLTGLRGPEVSGLAAPRREKTPAMPHELKRVLWPYALLGASMNGTAYLMANLLPVLAVSHMGLSEAAASSLYVVTAVISLSGPLWGWVADRFNLKLVLGVRAIGNVFSSLIWLLLPTYLGLAIGKVADDVGKAAFRPAWGAVMANVSALDSARRSQTLAMMSTAEDAGELGAPILAGLIWSAFGLPAVLLLRAGAGLATECYSWLLAKSLSLEKEADNGEAASPNPAPRRAR
ncbi:MAG: MFS transporter [Propionibacteriaceae bacterium]|nr:MFS transporter [Propionibacteriaceae bacterium]